MSLGPGTRLGPYDVTAQIGQGGMGEVYRARDTKLNRDVALKVLPDAFASDPDRLARFQREAQVLASLNHPNIAAIHGLEEADGVRALVLELVEGPTLADRIKQGPVPIEEALPIAKQIAEALEAAHEAGVIHRDLKPANIKLRPDGAVKVLDFGLAKALDPSPEGDPSQSPTLTAAATQMGVIMGTAAYMSPEQAAGQVADKRSDIWSFGVVLYEMLTGQRLFTGETVSHVLAKVLERDIDFGALPTPTPAPMKRLLRRCLERRPKRRLGEAGEALIHLEEAIEAPDEPSLVPPSAAPQTADWRQAAPWALGMLVAGSLITGFAVWSLTRPTPAILRVERYDVSPPAPRTLGVAFNSPEVAITPDGSRVVYTTTGGSPAQLFVRAVDALTATPLQGLDGPLFAPFVSPNGEWVGYNDQSDGTLKRVSIHGGPSVTICDVNAGAATASWGIDDTIVFGTNILGGLWRVSANSGNPEPLTTAEEGNNHAFPHMLPGGRAVLYTIQTPGPVENNQVAVVNLDTQEQKTLVPGGSYPRYSPTGHLVYAVSGTLRAVGFDLDLLEVTDPNPVPVLDGVVTKPLGAADFDIAGDGSLVYVAGSSTIGVERTLVWVDREGGETTVAADPDDYMGLQLSPDGRRALVQMSVNGAADLMVYDLDRDTPTRLTFDPGNDDFATWSHDGQRVYFTSTREGGPRDLYWKAADGTGDVEKMIVSEGQPGAWSWSPDGGTMVVNEMHPDGNMDVGLLAMDRPDEPIEWVLDGSSTEGWPEVSPDGRWMAYIDNASGQFEVFVTSFPSGDGRWQISRDGGFAPVWGPDSRELFYQTNADGLIQVMAAVNETEPVFNPGTPVVLFEGPYRSGAPNNPRVFDVSPDGSRFLMIKEPIEAVTRNAILVKNWFEELKRLVPVP